MAVGATWIGSPESFIFQDTLFNKVFPMPNRIITRQLSLPLEISRFVPEGLDYFSENKISPIGRNQISDYRIPIDAVIHQSLNGQFFYAPADADFQTVFNAGRTNGRFNITALKKSIALNGIFDYQRNKGHGDISPALNIFYPAYTEASNYAVGTYMRGAGYTLLGTYISGIGYALYTGINYWHALSLEMWQWWANGWNAANEGIPNGVQ